MGLSILFLNNTPSQFIMDFLAANQLKSIYIIREKEYFENVTKNSFNSEFVDYPENLTIAHFMNQLSKSNIQIAVVDYPMRYCALSSF